MNEEGGERGDREESEEGGERGDRVVSREDGRWVTEE